MSAFPPTATTPGPDPAIIAEVAAVARRADAVRRDGGSDADRSDADRSDQVPVVLSDRGGAGGELVFRVSDMVVKLHHRPDDPDADPAALAARLRLTTDPRLRGVLLAPLPLGPSDGPAPAWSTTIRGRTVTAWPVGTPVDPHDPDAAPWRPAGELLARLHAGPTPPDLPPMAGPARAARAIRRLVAAAQGAGTPAAIGRCAGIVQRAYATLPPWAAGSGRRDPGDPGDPGDPRMLVHGDWHLGQLVRVGGRWIMIDIDTLGVGDPAWDLARPAAWFAAGILAPQYWYRLLDAYRDAGGRAVSGADPWPVLDVPARALTIQAAALAVAKAAALRAGPADDGPTNHDPDDDLYPGSGLDGLGAELVALLRPDDIWPQARSGCAGSVSCFTAAT